MSEWVGAEWGYCDLYLGGLLQAVWAWQGSAGVFGRAWLYRAIGAAPGKERQDWAAENRFTGASSLQNIRFPAKPVEKEKTERFSFAEA